MYRHAEGFDPTSVFVALTLSPSQIVAIIVGTAWTGKQVVFGGELLVVWATADRGGAISILCPGPASFLACWLHRDQDTIAPAILTLDGHLCPKLGGT